MPLVLAFHKWLPSHRVASFCGREIRRYSFTIQASYCGHVCWRPQESSLWCREVSASSTQRTSANKTATPAAHTCAAQLTDTFSPSSPKSNPTGQDHAAQMIGGWASPAGHLSLFLSGTPRGSWNWHGRLFSQFTDLEAEALIVGTRLPFLDLFLDVLDLLLSA